MTPRRLCDAASCLHAQALHVWNGGNRGNASEPGRTPFRPDPELGERHRQARDEIEGVIPGGAMPEGEAGNNMARGALLRAGLPDTVPGMTVNLFCSSGGCGYHTGH